MSFAESWLLALPVLLALATLTWLASVVIRNVGIVDSLWSLFFLAAAGVFWFGLPGIHPRSIVVTCLLAAWALRLSVYITVRNFGQPEDRRYRAIRDKHQPGFAWKSIYIVFWLQALLAWVISAPLLIAVRAAAPLGAVDLLAMLFWLTGFLFESVGDWQLQRFRGDPGNRGRVLQTGLWRYTRHPNYFGEACIWWSFYLFALPGGGWWTAFAPLLMTVLLLRVSGVALLEKDIGDRRPAYKNYVRRTNAFLPGPPRTGDSA